MPAAEPPGRAGRLLLALCLAGAIAPGPVLAAEDPATSAGQDVPATLAGIRSALGLSAFFDVRAADAGTDPNVFSMGDFELDVARELGRHVQVGAALVVNGEGTALSVGFVDVHLLGAPVAPRGRLPVEKGFHVQLGRFDVPFGGDWQYFAAKDRTELSAPLTTDVVLDGGDNDVGLRLLGATESLGWSAYWLRGEGKGTAFGGRLVLTPFDNVYRLRNRVRAVEVGFSSRIDLDGDGGIETTSFAVDAELRGPIGRLRVEWVRRDERPVPGRETSLPKSGFHATASVGAGAPAGVPLTAYARYDTANVEPTPSGSETAGRTKRLTVGLNALFFDLLSLKLEVQRLLSAFRRDSFLAQAVVTF